MLEIERLMKPIDSFTVGEPAELGALASAAQSIETMLRATPQLFAEHERSKRSHARPSPRN